MIWKYGMLVKISNSSYSSCNYIVQGIFFYFNFGPSQNVMWVKAGKNHIEVI
jgi:hypothetical protein